MPQGSVKFWFDLLGDQGPARLHQWSRLGTGRERNKENKETKQKKKKKKNLSLAAASFVRYELAGNV